MKIDIKGRIQHPAPPRLAMLVGVAALYALSLLLWLIAPGLYRSSGEWEPYYIVTTNLTPADAREMLNQARDGDLVTEVVTEETTEVLVTRFNRVETMTLTAALNQLDPLDPRRDPFIEGLSRYFTGATAGQSLIYLRSDGPRRRISGLVRRVLGSGSRLVGWEPVRVLVSLGLFLAAAAATVIRQGRFRLLVIAGLVPWLPFVVAGGISGAVGAALICIAWSHALTNVALFLEGSESGRELLRGTLRHGAWPGLVIAATLGVVWGNSGPRDALAVFAAVMGLSAVTASVFFFRLGSLIHRDHDLFAPVSILTGRAAGVAGRARLAASRALPILLIALFLVIPPVADTIIAARSPTVPGRVAIGGANRVSYSSIGALWSTQLPDALVDLSDYAAHRAYQQSLAFGREYRPPTEGEAVTLSRFRETEDGAYNRYGEDVLVFDTQWLNDAISAAPAGIAALLVSTGEATGVVPTRRHGLYSSYSQLLKHTAYVLLALVPAALSGHRLPRFRRGGSKVVEIARRRKQVA